MKTRYVLIAALVALMAAGCGQRQKLEGYTFSGTLEMTEHGLGARVAGRVATLGVDEGDVVKTGQVLATLDRYDQAKRDYERLQVIYKEGGAAQQTLEYAQLALEDQQVVAPFDGVVLVKVHEIGEVLTSGTPIVIVGDRKDLWVKIFVPEGVINQLQLNQPAQVRFDGVKEPVEGRVSYIAPRAEFTPRNVQTPEERVTQTFAVKIRISQPPAFVRPGVAADVTFPTQTL